MGKKMLFPLEMRNGEKVYTLVELREKLDVGRLLEYAENGRLEKWLQDREAVEMAAKIESLDKTSEEFARGVCEVILGEVNEEILSRIADAKVEKEAAKAKKEEAAKAAAEQRRIEEEQAAAEQLRIEKERKKEVEFDLLAEVMKDIELEENTDGMKVVRSSDPAAKVLRKVMADSPTGLPIQRFVGTEYRDSAEETIQKLYDSKGIINIGEAKKLVILARKAGCNVYQGFGCLYLALKPLERMKFGPLCAKVLGCEIQESKEAEKTEDNAILSLSQAGKDAIQRATGILKNYIK